MRALILVLATTLTGCASLSVPELTKWTRHWEQEMGVPPHGLVFFHVPRKDTPWPDHCGVGGANALKPVGFYPEWPDSWIVYQTSCWWMSEEALALHEVCHTRLRHHEVILAEDEDEDYRLKEEEVAFCVWAYSEREGQEVQGEGENPGR